MSRIIGGTGKGRRLRTPRGVFVDQSRAAIEVIRENARLVAAAGGDVQIYHQDARIALAALADSGVRFDVVYLDPPYTSPLYEPLLEEAARLLDTTGVVVAEHFHKRALPETIGGLVSTRSVRIGDHTLTFYARHAGGEGPPEGPATGGRRGPA